MPQPIILLGSMSETVEMALDGGEGSVYTIFYCLVCVYAVVLFGSRKRGVNITPFLPYVKALFVFVFTLLFVSLVCVKVMQKGTVFGYLEALITITIGGEEGVVKVLAKTASFLIVLCIVTLAGKLLAGPLQASAQMGKFFYWACVDLSKGDYTIKKQHEQKIQALLEKYGFSAVMFKQARSSRAIKLWMMCFSLIEHINEFEASSRRGVRRYFRGHRTQVLELRRRLDQLNRKVLEYQRLKIQVVADLRARHKDWDQMDIQNELNKTRGNSDELTVRTISELENNISFSAFQVLTRTHEFIVQMLISVFWRSKSRVVILADMGFKIKALPMRSNAVLLSGMIVFAVILTIVSLGMEVRGLENPSVGQIQTRRIAMTIMIAFMYSIPAFAVYTMRWCWRHKRFKHMWFIKFVKNYTGAIGLAIICTITVGFVYSFLVEVEELTNTPWDDLLDLGYLRLLRLPWIVMPIALALTLGIITDAVRSCSVKARVMSGFITGIVMAAAFTVTWMMFVGLNSPVGDDVMGKGAPSRYLNFHVVEKVSAFPLIENQKEEYSSFRDKLDGFPVEQLVPPYEPIVIMNCVIGGILGATLPFWFLQLRSEEYLKDERSYIRL